MSLQTSRPVRLSERIGPKVFQIDWGGFSLVEFLVAEKQNIGTKFRNGLDIGSGAGVHSAILRHAGLEIFQLDKYSETAEYQVDFLEHDFDQRFDVIFCSHVIEHQRNVGLFLDKIFDILSEEGVLIISAPKHAAETLIEGHLNSFIFPYFLQHLIHAGFDCKNGKFMSVGGIENFFIVPKAANYSAEERNEQGYQWTAKMQDRSFLPLQNQTITNDIWHHHNCNVFQIGTQGGQQQLSYFLPDGYQPFGIKIDMQRWGVAFEI